MTTIARSGFYSYPEAARGWTAEQRRSYTFGRQQDAHYRDYLAHARLAAVRQANDDFAAAIKSAGGIGAYLQSLRVA